MSDKMGGSSNTKVPAWKLRQQQRQNGTSGSRNAANDELGGTRPRAVNELDSKPNSSAKIPAWKLREQAKSRRGGDFDDSNSIASSGSTRSTYSRSSTFREQSKPGSRGDFDDCSVASSGSTRSTYSRTSTYSRSSISSHPNRNIRSVSRVPEDPSLPPAFRAANRVQQRKKNPDDFFSLSSVHSSSQTGTYSRANSLGSDSFEFLDGSDDDDSFDGEDSFASLDSDADEDDEAYRESRNQLARLKIKQQSEETKRVGGKSRFSKKSTGTTLDFIAE